LDYLVIDSRNSGKRYDLVVAAMLVIGPHRIDAGPGLSAGFEKYGHVRWGSVHES